VMNSEPPTFSIRPNCGPSTETKRQYFICRSSEKRISGPSDYSQESTDRKSDPTIQPHRIPCSVAGLLSCNISDDGQFEYLVTVGFDHGHDHHHEKAQP